MNQLKKTIEDNKRTCILYYKMSRRINTIKENIRVDFLRHRLQRQGIKIVSEIQRSMLNNGIIAYPDFGTLLGIVREKRILKHDSDIDIGVAPSSVQNSCVIQKIMKSLGFQLCGSYEANGKIREQSYLKNSIKIDFQYYYVENEMENLMYCMLFYNTLYREELSSIGDFKYKTTMKCVKKICPIVKKLIDFDIDGCRICIPQNYNDVLIYKYGENWRIPDKGWKYWEGPNTLKCEENGYHYF